MHSFALMNTPTHQIGQSPQASQAAPHPSQGASGPWSANTTQQYMTGNTGVQLSRSANFALQNGVNPSRQMANWQSADTSHLAAQSKNASRFKDHVLLRLLLDQPQYKLNKSLNKYVPVPNTCVSQSAAMQNYQQNIANQGLCSTAVTNATYGQQNTSVLSKQPVSFNEAQTNRIADASHLQQSWTQQAFHPAANGGMTRTISSYTAAPSLPYDQMVNANTVQAAAVHNGQTQVAPNQIHRQSFSQGGCSQNFTSSCGMATSQSFRNNNVPTQCTSSNAQTTYASNIGQINQRPSTQCNPSYNNCGGFRSINVLKQFERNFLTKTNERLLNHDAPPQQMFRQNMDADSVRKSYTGSSGPPPPYENHHYTTVSRMSNQNIQTAHSESYSSKASQSLLLHSGQPLPENVMLRVQQTVNASFQQNSLPHVLGVNTSGYGGGSGHVVTINETVAKRCPIGSLSNASQGSERMLLHRSEPQAIVASNSNKNIGMPSSFKQNDSCASSMSGHTGIRAVAVVPPLSQEEHNSPATAEPCKSVDDAEKRCPSPDVAIIHETTSVREEFNRNRVTPNKVASDDEVVQTISNSESESLAQTPRQDNHESVVQRVSEVSVSQTGSGKQTEGASPQSPPVHELSLLPTKSWTVEALTKLILEMEAEPKPKDTLELPNIVKIVIVVWNKNIAALFKSYKETFQTGFLSDIEKFCETHIKRDTSILTQVSPDFKDQLKRYKILNEGEVYSESPYESMWLNVNDQLDDIDKEFGFPWALKRHLYVDETKSEGYDFKTLENVPEQAASEAVNKVLPLAESDSVDMTEESETPQNLPASPQELSRNSSYESSYLFKIEVLPPEEAKVIFEQVQQNEHQSFNCEKETSVSGSEQREGSEDMDSTINDPKLKKSSDNQLEEICCLARFIEMNSGLGKPSFKCQCRDNQNAKEGTIEILKPDPDTLPVDQKDVNSQTANLNGHKLSSNLSQIIDLTDDNQFLSFFDKEPEPIFQTCSQSNAVGLSNHKHGELSADFPSPKEMHNLVFEEKESESEHVQEKLSSTGAVQSNDSVRYTQLNKFDPSKVIETKEPFPLFNREENCKQAPVTSDDQAASPSENKTQTQVSDSTNQTSLNLHVNNRGSEKKEKRQSSLELYFPSLKKPKKCRLSVASDPHHTSEAQDSASEEKTVELVLFGAGQQGLGSPSGKEKSLVSSQICASYEKHRPPGVLYLKLDSLRRNTSTADPTREYSVKQLIYEKWRKSIPTMSGSVAFQRKNKLRRHTSLPTLVSCESTKEKVQTISSEMGASERTKKYILSLKKKRALVDRRRHEEKKRRRYSVTLEQPEHPQGSETSDEMSLHDSIVLKFSILPNTFNLTDESRGTEAVEPVSDKLEPVEEKDTFPEKAATKPKGIWYRNQAKQFKPLRVSKNVGLFHEYQKKYKEKTCTSTDD